MILNPHLGSIQPRRCSAIFLIPLFYLFPSVIDRHLATLPDGGILLPTINSVRDAEWNCASDTYILNFIPDIGEILNNLLRFFPEFNAICN